MYVCMRLQFQMLLFSLLSERTHMHTLQIGPFYLGICDDRKTSRNVSCAREENRKKGVRGRGRKWGQGIRGNFTLYHKNERFSIFLISVNNSTNTLQGKELINANIYRYSERAKTADKLMKFLHDNNANADNDDSGKLHAESSLRNMKSTYWTKGGREDWVWG